MHSSMPSSLHYSTNLKSIFTSHPQKLVFFSMLGHNSPIVCCMELVLVSKDSPSKELSNGILNLSRDSPQAEIKTFQTRYLKQP